jgi:hypothetical protein
MKLVVGTSMHYVDEQVLKAVLANVSIDTTIDNKDAALNMRSLRTAKEIYDGSDLLGLSKTA